MILTVSVVFMRLAGMEAKRVSEGMVEYLGRFLATPSKHKHANVTRDARMSEEEDE